MLNFKGKDKMKQEKYYMFDSLRETSRVKKENERKFKRTETNFDLPTGITKGVTTSESGGNAKKSVAPTPTPNSKSTLYNRAIKIHSDVCEDNVKQKYNQKELKSMMESIISYVEPIQLDMSSRSRSGDIDLPNAHQSFVEPQNKEETKPSTEPEEHIEDPSAQTAVVESPIKEEDKQESATETETETEVEKETEVVRKPSSEMVDRAISEEKSKKKEEEEIIININVFDASKQVEKSFPCSKNALAEHMGYFANIMKVQQIENFDISIHCNLEVFAWILQWIKYIKWQRAFEKQAALKKKETSDEASGSETEKESSPCPTKTPREMEVVQGPELTPQNVLPIIASACFLEMEMLLDYCLKYCHQHLNEVLRTKPDFSCLDDRCLTRLALLYSNSELDEIFDTNDIITPYLWIKLILDLCKDTMSNRGNFYSINSLSHCRDCKQIITATVKHQIPCKSSNMRLNRWGQVYYRHSPDPHWKMNDFILKLFNQFQSWRNVYWKLWSYSHVLFCYRCKKYFPIWQMNFCRHHSGQVVSDDTADYKYYSCCKRPYSQFQLNCQADGCQFEKHSILLKTNTDIGVFGVLQTLQNSEWIYDKAKVLDSKNETHFPYLLPCRQYLLPLEVTLSNLKLPGSSSSKTKQQKKSKKPGAKSKKVEFDFDSDSIANSSSKSSTKAHVGSPHSSSTSKNRYSLSKKSSVENLLVRKQPLSRQRSSASSKKGLSCRREIVGVPRTLSMDPEPLSKQPSQRRLALEDSDMISRSWSQKASIRCNQDHQRQCEERLFKDILSLVESKMGIEEDKEKVEVVQFNGGAFMKLEADWRKEFDPRYNMEEKIVADPKPMRSRKTY